VVYPPLHTFLPHRPPMLLIDELVHCDEHEVVCTVTIRDGAPFVADGRVPALISLEYFAQTVAALLRLPPPHHPGGFTTACCSAPASSSSITDYFHVGDTLTVTGHELWHDEQLAQFRCELLRGRTTASPRRHLRAPRRTAAPEAP
jgi:predicted hotdog family 3-hydroxylacyl-ACP dehydratase